MKIQFSVIIPVYNRPNEIDELLASFLKQDFKSDYEIIIVEDGSELTSETIVQNYQSELNISYYFKENTGAGLSRNYGMERANGTYFIILDSDVILPETYLSSVFEALTHSFTDAFGGPDKAHKNFTSLQKAINYSMTSVLTTGGIRGKKKSVGKFQPRSFNMGISKKAFEITQGFKEYSAGEDIDLSFRLWASGFETQLISEAFVYHKRRTSISQFFKQTFAFGSARPILNKRFPSTKKITYWFPSVFIIGFDVALILVLFGHWHFLACYGLYVVALFLDALIQNKSLQVAFLSIITTFTQFYGYGLGFLKSHFFNVSK